MKRREFLKLSGAVLAVPTSVLATPVTDTSIYTINVADSKTVIQKVNQNKLLIREIIRGRPVLSTVIS